MIENLSDRWRQQQQVKPKDNKEKVKADSSETSNADVGLQQHCTVVVDEKKRFVKLKWFAMKIHSLFAHPHASGRSGEVF